MNKIKNKIPIKSKSIEIEKNESGYLIYDTYCNRHIQLNDLSYQVFLLINGQNNLHEIQYLLNNKGLEIKLKDLADLIFNRFGKCGIVVTENVQKSTIPNYLKLSFTLISENMVNKISNNLVFLFKNSIFYSLLIISLFIILIGIYFNFSSLVIMFDELYLPEVIFYLFLSGFFLFFHELGHSSACCNFGVRSGFIGFGFYLFRPVMFTDVSRIWKLNIQKRIIVNLAGIYFDFLVSAFLMILYFFSSINFFLLLGITIFSGSIVNLNPFLRYDGYWILSDLVKIPNLKNKSDLILIDVYKKIINGNKVTFTKSKTFLFIYGIISNFFYFFIFLFI